MPRQDVTLVSPQTARRALLSLDARLALRGAIILIAVSAGLTAVDVVQYAATFSTVDAAHSLELIAQNPAIRTLFGIPRALDDAGGFTVWRTGTIVVVAAAAWALTAVTRLTRGEEDTGRAWLTLVGPLRLRSALLLHLLVVGAIAVVFGAAIGLTMIASGGTSPALSRRYFSITSTEFREGPNRIVGTRARTRSAASETDSLSELFLTPSSSFTTGGL